MGKAGLTERRRAVDDIGRVVEARRDHGDRRRDAAEGSSQLRVTHYPASFPIANLGSKCKHGRIELVHGR